MKKMKRTGESEGQSASKLISARIADLGAWRGKTLGRMRQLIKEEDPDVVEEWKWMGTPVWEHDGIICTGESYRNVALNPSRKSKPSKKAGSGAGRRSRTR
jgi:hypothetical protein